MKPFRVTIQLAGPMIIPKHPIHLDGLLAALHVQALEEAGHPSPWDEQHNLPWSVTLRSRVNGYSRPVCYGAPPH